MNQLEDLLEFVRIDTTSAKGKGEEGAKFIKDYMERHGIEARLIRHQSKNPYVYGEINVKAKRTLLVYNHYDVQPVEPLDRWESDPFTPVMKEGKIVGRGVGDDKGSLMARLQGILEMEKLPSLNLKFIYEGEEEIGSPNIDSFLRDYKDLLKADYVLWEGAGKGSSGAPEIVLGVKGLLYVEISTRTAKDLHSMYAPVAKNPAWKLVEVLLSLKRDGKVAVPGFYDKVKWLTKEEVSFLKGDKKSMEEAISQEVPEDFQRRLVEEPTCNIAGLYSGYTGEGSKTVIPSYAMAKLDFRLVPEQDPDEILNSLKSYLRDVDIRVLGRVRPYRTSINSEVARCLIDSAKEVYGMDPEVLPNSYGTGPMESFARILENNQIADGIGVDYPGSNIHSFNENIFVQDYLKAKEWMRSFVKRLAQL
ncbi:MAG: M20/M25/M40 family metallo-hydrolase [Metallosphaera sp.]